MKNSKQSSDPSKYTEYLSHDESMSVKNIDILKKMFPEFNDKKVLDIGCGKGIVTSFLAKKNKVYGIDKEKHAIKEAATRGIIAKQHDLEKRLPFLENFFDFVVCKDVLEHTLEPEKIIQEIRRVLKPGGRVFVHVPNEFTLIDRLKFLFGRGIVKKRWFHNSNEWNYPHVRFFTKKGLKNLLKQADFKIEKDFSNQWSFLKMTWLSKLHSGLFSPGVTFLCKKSN